MTKITFLKKYRRADGVGQFVQFARENVDILSPTEMSEPCEVLIGSKGADHVTILLSGRWHEDWRGAAIEVRCDGWGGHIRGEFMKGELASFGKDVALLHRRLTGIAQLNPVEAGLTLTLTGDGKGHITVEGTARHRFETGTILTFRFVIDQTYLDGLGELLLAADPD